MTQTLTDAEIVCLRTIATTPTQHQHTQTHTRLFHLKLFEFVGSSSRPFKLTAAAAAVLEREQTVVRLAALWCSPTYPVRVALDQLADSLKNPLTSENMDRVRDYLRTSTILAPHNPGDGFDGSPAGTFTPDDRQPWQVAADLKLATALDVSLAGVFTPPEPVKLGWTSPECSHYSGPRPKLPCDMEDTVEAARWLKDDDVPEWWRIVRVVDHATCCRLESISVRSLERGLTWAHAAELEFAAMETIDEHRVRAEVAKYLGLKAGDRMRASTAVTDKEARAALVAPVMTSIPELMKIQSTPIGPVRVTATPAVHAAIERGLEMSQPAPKVLVDLESLSRPAKDWPDDKVTAGKRSAMPGVELARATENGITWRIRRVNTYSPTCHLEYASIPATEWRWAHACTLEIPLDEYVGCTRVLTEAKTHVKPVNPRPAPATPDPYVSAQPRGSVQPPPSNELVRTHIEGVTWRIVRVDGDMCALEYNDAPATDWLPAWQLSVPPTNYLTTSELINEVAYYKSTRRARFPSDHPNRFRVPRPVVDVGSRPWPVVPGPEGMPGTTELARAEIFSGDLYRITRVDLTASVCRLERSEQCAGAAPYWAYQCEILIPRSETVTQERVRCEAHDWRRKLAEVPPSKAATGFAPAPAPTVPQLLNKLGLATVDPGVPAAAVILAPPIPDYPPPAAPADLELARVARTEDTHIEANGTVWWRLVQVDRLMVAGGELLARLEIATMPIPGQPSVWKPMARRGGECWLSVNAKITPDHVIAQIDKYKALCRLMDSNRLVQPEPSRADLAEAAHTDPVTLETGRTLYEGSRSTDPRPADWQAEAAKDWYAAGTKLDERLEGRVVIECPSNECQIRKLCTGHANCTSQHPEPGTEAHRQQASARFRNAPVSVAAVKEWHAARASYAEDLQDKADAHGDPESHATHGRGTEADGPDDPDCPCRGTDAESACALERCGFCMGSQHVKNAIPGARIDAPILTTAPLEPSLHPDAIHENPNGDIGELWAPVHPPTAEALERKRALVDDPTPVDLDALERTIAERGECAGPRTTFPRPGSSEVSIIARDNWVEVIRWLDAMSNTVPLVIAELRERRAWHAHAFGKPVLASARTDVPQYTAEQAKDAFGFEVPPLKHSADLYGVEGPVLDVNLAPIKPGRVYKNPGFRTARPLLTTRELLGADPPPTVMRSLVDVPALLEPVVREDVHVTTQALGVGLLRERQRAALAYAAAKLAEAGELGTASAIVLLNQIAEDM